MCSEFAVPEDLSMLLTRHSVLSVRSKGKKCLNLFRRKPVISWLLQTATPTQFNNSVSYSLTVMIRTNDKKGLCPHNLFFFFFCRKVLAVVLGLCGERKKCCVLFQLTCANFVCIKHTYNKLTTCKWHKTYQHHISVQQIWSRMIITVSVMLFSVW